MQDDEYLGVHIRSSIAVKSIFLLLIIRASLMPTIIIMQITRGHIMLALLNMGTEPVALAKNERVAQGIFINIL